MYKNWKIKKSDLLDEEKAERLAKEQDEVAKWCNDNQQYQINDNEEYIFVEPIPEPTVEEKQEQMRAIRKMYLEQFVDPFVSNPLRWADLTAEEQQVYVDYRRYLINYTKGENWWEQAPKTLEEWKQ